MLPFRDVDMRVWGKTAGANRLALHHMVHDLRPKLTFHADKQPFFANRAAHRLSTSRDIVVDLFCWLRTRADTDAARRAVFEAIIAELPDRADKLREPGADAVAVAASRCISHSDRMQ